MVLDKMVCLQLDYEQSLTFLRDSRVGEHASARENSSRRRASRLLEVIFAHARVLSHSTTCIPEKNEGLLVV